MLGHDRNQGTTNTNEFQELVSIIKTMQVQQRELMKQVGELASNNTTNITEMTTNMGKLSEELAVIKDTIKREDRTEAPSIISSNVFKIHTKRYQIHSHPGLTSVKTVLVVL